MLSSIARSICRACGLQLCVKACWRHQGHMHLTAEFDQIASVSCSSHGLSGAAAATIALSDWFPGLWQFMHAISTASHRPQCPVPQHSQAAAAATASSSHCACDHSGCNTQSWSSHPDMDHAPQQQRSISTCNWGDCHSNLRSHGSSMGKAAAASHNLDAPASIRAPIRYASTTGSPKPATPTSQGGCSSNSSSSRISNGHCNNNSSSSASLYQDLCEAGAECTVSKAAGSSGRQPKRMKQQHQPHSGSNHQHPSQLTACIKRAGSPGQLVQLVHQHGTSFNKIHISATLTHLVKMCRTDQTIRQQSAVQQLLQLLEQRLLLALHEQWTSRELANIIWAAGHLGCKSVVALLLPLFTEAHMMTATPQALSNTLWAVATVGLQAPANQLQQMLAALVKQLSTAHPQAISNTLWAAATMQRQVAADQQQQQQSTGRQQQPQGDLVPNEYMESLLYAFMERLQQAQAQHVSNVLLACGHFRYMPKQLLAALDSNRHLLQQLQIGMSPHELANTAWACGLLGYKGIRLPGALLKRAVQLRLPGMSSQGVEVFTPQGLATLCWAAAVLDLQQHATEVLRLSFACSQQWSRGALVGVESKQQLYQVHLWLLDCQLPSAGQGLSRAFTQQQLQQCQDSWRRARPRTTRFHQSVFAALQQLPAGTWQQQPRIEQRSADGAYSLDIAATTAAGVQLAIEVDGPWHFVRPDGALNGPTMYRNRGLAARGYAVVSIPYWEWDEQWTIQQQLGYLQAKLLAG